MSQAACHRCGNDIHIGGEVVIYHPECDPATIYRKVGIALKAYPDSDLVSLAQTMTTRLDVCESKLARLEEFMQTTHGQNWTDKPMDEFLALVVKGVEDIMREPL